MTDITSYIDAHLEEAIAQLGEYVALPTVSAQRQAIPETAQFVRAMLESVGATAEVLEKEAPGHPVVNVARDINDVREHRAGGGHLPSALSVEHHRTHRIPRNEDPVVVIPHGREQVGLRNEGGVDPNLEARGGALRNGQELDDVVEVVFGLEDGLSADS